MEYTDILFFVTVIFMSIIFIVFYSYISKKIDKYIIPLITSQNTTTSDTRVNQIKLTMKTLDEK